MKTTIVPAQVTSVEDKIAGNLSFTQMLLLITPVFVGAAIFILLPPFIRVTAPKNILVCTFALCCSMLAVRVKGVIVLNWVMLITSYLRRPKYSVYNKNSTDHRPKQTDKAVEPEQTIIEEVLHAEAIPHLSGTQLAKAHLLITNPERNFHFKTDKKGVLRAYIHEIAEEAV